MTSKMTIARLLGAAVAGLCLSMAGAAATACTMLPPPRTPPPAAEMERQAREAVARAHAVIEVEVVAGNGAGVGTIRVLQAVKGPYGAGMVLPARPVDGAACGPGTLVTGQRLLLFLGGLPSDGEPVLVRQTASPGIRAALVRLALLDS